MIGPCPDRGPAEEQTEPYWPRTQLVDSGYIENTGLATITDLAPEWLTLVRNHNIAATDQDNNLPIIVPFVVYLANGDPDTAHPQLNEGQTSEIALPLRTYLKAGVSLSTSDALLERARKAVSLPAFCETPSEVSDGADPCAAVDAAMPRRVIVIDRLPQPEVAAPLGWALSQSSRATLDGAIGDQIDMRCGKRGSPRSCRLGYAPLGELRHYYGLN